MESNFQKKKFDDMKKALEERNYEIVKSLGKGAFGEVVLARNKKNELFAVKFIGKAQIKKKPFLQKYINQQISIMKELCHPNIVKYEEEFRTNDFIIIIMEYCEMGNLLTYQAKLPGKTFPLKQATKVLVQVLRGLKCIHEKNFLHRDIKSQNVLLKKVNNDIGYKIADFGFARSIGSSGAKTHCGTEKYMAPEILSNSYYGISVDIWAIGVLFYFMLFAEYPFKGHDMKGEINKRCSNPYFSVQATVGKKQLLKDLPSSVQDFFKKIFVVDPKKRTQFSQLKDHPLFIEYANQFKQTNNFYKNYEGKEEQRKDEIVQNEYGLDADMQAEDESRTQLIKKKDISQASKHLERDLEEIFFQIERIEYLKECANQIYDTYNAYLKYPERVAAKFYLLKAYLFFAEPLLQSLSSCQTPDTLIETGIGEAKFIQCTKTVEYKKRVNKLNEEIMKTQILFEDTYNEAAAILNEIPIKNFDKGFKLAITQKKFDDLKFSYRTTTSYLFKVIHENKKLDSHTRNKIKMRLFCCHMINRIFNRKQIKDHFPYFMIWLQHKNYHYSHTFDMTYFKKWIYEENQQNLEKNISLLHKTYF